MLYKEEIENAEIASIDGRMLNVRTRHEILRQVHTFLTINAKEFLAAINQDFFKSRQSLHQDDSSQISFELILRNIGFLANQLDQEKDVILRHTVEKMKNKERFIKTLPVGLVSIILQDSNNLEHPIDAIFSPFVSAIATGNAVIVGLNKVEHQSTFTLLQRLFKTILDGKTCILIDNAEEITNFASEKSNLIVSFGKYYKNNKRCIQIVPDQRNVIIVDASTVDDSFYRTKKPSSKDVKKIKQIAKITFDAKKYSKHLIFVSENIYPAFLKEYREIGGQKDDVQATTSIQHVLYNLKKVQINNLVCFGSLKFASFYSDNVECTNVSINNYPIDLQVGYCPSNSNIYQLSSKTNGEIFELEPIWTSNHFIKSKPILSWTLPSITTKNITQDGLKENKRCLIGKMKRAKPDHLEFFPTGFVITAFPTFATILGVSAYLGFRTISYTYHTFMKA